MHVLESRRKTIRVAGYQAEMVQVSASKSAGGPPLPGVLRWAGGRLSVVLGGRSGVGVEVDTDRHEFRVTRPGRPDPVLRLPGSAVRLLPGCLLGLVRDDGDDAPVVRPFPAGAWLVLVNKGLLAAGQVGRGEAFGVGRLLASVDSARSAPAVAGRILEAVSRHLSGLAPEDEVTVVVIARTAAAVVQVASELPQAA
jgi:hypothetical protein